MGLDSMYVFSSSKPIYCNFSTTSASKILKHSDRTEGRRETILTGLGSFDLEQQNLINSSMIFIITVPINSTK